jgi:hypothetical protein
MSYVSSSFCSGYFGDKFSLFAKASLEWDPPVLDFLS